MRATQNVAFDSATSFALFDDAARRNQRARQIAVGNERLRALGLEGDAVAAWNRSKQARTAATMSMVGDVMSDLSKVSGGDISSAMKVLG